jgi:beta-lactamase class A
MERCRTGSARLLGRLPLGTVVAHKTGTIGGSVNDVGVVTLPADGKKLVIAVLIKKSDRPVEDRERAIADIARSVRDYYLFKD